MIKILIVFPPHEYELLVTSANSGDGREQAKGVDAESEGFGSWQL